MLTYIALGDSITYGESASSFSNAYPQQTTSILLARGTRVKSYIVAKSGWSSSNLANAVFRDPGLYRQSDIVSIWIGGDDLLYAAADSFYNKRVLDGHTAIARYYRNMGNIICRIKSVSNAKIICCTQYNPFPNSPLAHKWINTLNSTTRQLASVTHVQVAPVHSWFEGNQSGLISGYRTGRIEDSLLGHLPIHPNDSGHQVIARGLYRYLL